jgi:hypothetical protein
MDLPIHFPSEPDKIFAEASAYRRLTSDERFDILFDLIASGTTLFEDAPNQEARLRLQQEAKQQWQQIHKELFARHGF